MDGHTPMTAPQPVSPGHGLPSFPTTGASEGTAAAPASPAAEHKSDQAQPDGAAHHEDAQTVAEPVDPQRTSANADTSNALQSIQNGISPSLEQPGSRGTTPQPPGSAPKVRAMKNKEQKDALEAAFKRKSLSFR